MVTPCCPTITIRLEKLNNEPLLAFGKHLNEIRKKKGLSYRKLAQLCNTDHSDISKIEKGQINPTLLTIFDIANGLGITHKELMDFNFGG